MRMYVMKPEDYTIIIKPMVEIIYLFSADTMTTAAMSAAHLLQVPEAEFDTAVQKMTLKVFSCILKS